MSDTRGEATRTLETALTQRGHTFGISPVVDEPW